jgi:hypothetical protein
MGIKLKKIDRVPTSLKQLIDVDSSTGIPRCVDCISNGMILVADVPRDISKKDTFVFKNLTDIIKAGQGMQATLVNGVMTISSSLESLNLNDLLDVSIINPADDDVLTYNSVLQRWENTAGGWVPSTRLITINGVTQDLSADRTWVISTGGGSGTVTSVTGTGSVSGLTLSGTVTTAGNLTLGGTLVLTSGNITSGLGYTPYDASNPANYITSSALSAYLTIASASSTYLTQANAASTYLTIANAASTYQPIFTTQNGLTYGSAILKLGGGLTENTVVSGASGTYSLYLQRFSELKLNADDGSDSTEINLTPTQMKVKTPLYGSKSVGDVLTLKDAATGEVEFETPATGGGGLQYGVASGTNTYAVTISGVTGYTDGDTYVVKFTNGNDADSTININGLGVKTLVKEFNIQLTGGDIVSGQDLIIIYDGTNFQTLGVAPNQLFAYVTNADSVTINKGQPVYAFGAAGNRMSVKLASNTGDATSAQTVGLVFSTSIAAGQKGFIITQGVISGINTGSYSAGNTLYLGATAGTLTATKPYAPNHLVYIGTVERANAGNGQIYVKPQNGYELDELHNVDLVSTAPVNNDVLVFDTSTTPDLWKPKSIPTILGYTPVPPTRSITINGNTQNLSADVSFTVAAGGSSATIGTTIDGSGGTITVGQKGYVQIPYACTITGWRITTNATGTLVLDVDKAASGTIPTVSITGSAPPTLGGGQQTTFSSTLTGWTTTINANDMLGFTVDSAATVSWAILQLFVTKI